ncbi:MAG: hypothetical protein HC924_17635 [Synechococcaceae cyanobacterium SM2_3_2]|nr:hypothetical protein [Synechococcaceae cyanobacterium SM2_3_2]
MGHYPIILWPPALEAALCSYPRPPAFRRTQPTIPPEPPLLTGKVLAGPGILVVVLALGLATQSLPLAAVVLVLGLLGMGGTLLWDKKTRPARFKRYEKALIADLEYQQAKRQHQVLQEYLKTPAGIAQFRQQQVQRLLRQAQDPIGFDPQEPGIPEGSKAHFFRILSTYFPGQLSTTAHLTPDNPQAKPQAKPQRPDITLFEATHHLVIAILIDRPDCSVTPHPQDQIESDQARYDHFLRQGWVVIGLAQPQVVANAHSCAKVVAQVIADITGDDHDLRLFIAAGIPDLAPLAIGTGPQD